MPRSARRQCGAMAAHFRLLEMDPGFRARQSRLEQATQRLAHAPLRRRTPIQIPVVVHVVWRTPAENLSKRQIASQIAALNRDFRGRARDRKQVPAVWQGLAADAGIGFRLARRDPDGRPSTGITRTRTTRASFGTGDSVKSSKTGGADAWPSDRYLNLWVCTLAGGLLGYAQFPGGPKRTDGVVIAATAFGTSGTARAPFDRGRTAVHEVGHWLNLRHIWGDTEDCSGSDLVADTPNAAGPNYGRPSFPHVSCANGPNGDMFMNFMDYVDDAAMLLFTPEQVARMQATLRGPRRSFA
jgi:Pregnancy-associated plasma protein-A